MVAPFLWTQTFWCSRCPTRVTIETEVQTTWSVKEYIRWDREAAPCPVHPCDGKLHDLRVLLSTGQVGDAGPEGTPEEHRRWRERAFSTQPSATSGR